MQATRRKRPFGVTIIAILQALSAPATGFVILGSRIETHNLFADPRLDALAFVILIVGLIIAFSLWRLKRWAWAAVMIWTGVNLAISLYQYFQGQPDYAAMVQGIVVVFYLNQRDVRQAFEPIRSEV